MGDGREGRAGRLRARRADDGGQLMLLSGIIITIAFILTSLTLSQVSSLERAAATDRSSTLADEWRFLHERLATNLNVAVTPETTNDTLRTTVLPTVVATFRNIEAEKGYDTVIRIASTPASYNKTEANVHNGLVYTAWDAAGTYNFQGVGFDQSNDGIIFQKPCPTGSNPAVGCIAGVLLFVHLHDGVSSMEEVILFAVNRT